MSWLTSCSSTNRINYRKDDLRDGPFFYLTGTSGIGGIADIKSTYRRRITESYEYIGIDEATADSFITANPSTTTYDNVNHKTTNFKAQKVRDGDGGAYKIVCDSEVVYDLGYPL